jgi:hypothetical protein
LYIYIYIYIYIYVDKEEDVGSYWMTIRKGEDTLIWRRKLWIALCVDLGGRRIIKKKTKWMNDGGNIFSVRLVLTSHKMNDGGNIFSVRLVLTSHKTKRYISEDHILNFQRCNNLKYHVFIHTLVNYAVSNGDYTGWFGRKDQCFGA